MHALLLTALVVAAGGPPAVDPLTEAADPNDLSSLDKVFQAVAQRRAGDFSLDENHEIATRMILSRTARWIHVDEAELAREIAATKALVRRGDKPKVLLLVAEQNVEMARPFAWWSKAGAEVPRLDSFESRVMELLAGNGWGFVEQSTVTKVTPARPLSADLSDADALDLCRQGGGGRVVVGRVVASTPGGSDLSPGMTPAHASVTLHVIDCQTGRTLKRIDETVGDISTLDASAANAGIKALRLAGAHVADQVQACILETLPPL